MTEEEKKKLGLDDEDDEDDELDDDEDSDDDSDEDEDDEDSDDEEEGDEDPDDEDEDEDEEPRKKSKKIDFDKLSKEEAVKIAQSALAQKGKLKKKLAKLEKDGGDDESKKKVLKKKEERSQDQVNLQRIEFRQDHPELKRKDVDAVERFAKANGVSMEKALQDPFMKSYIRKRLEKRSAQDASINGRSQGASLRRKGEKDWGAASDADYQAKRREILTRRS